MSAVMEPGDDDGTTREAAGGITQITRGRFVYTSFPVRWDDEGRCAAVALDAYDTENCVREFVIVAPGDVNGDAGPGSAPHEQDGPLSEDWLWTVYYGRNGQTRCNGETIGGRCYSPTGDPSGLCKQHLREKERGRVLCQGIRPSGSRCSTLTDHPSGICGNHKRQRPDEGAE